MAKAYACMMVVDAQCWFGGGNVRVAALRRKGLRGTGSWKGEGSEGYALHMYLFQQDHGRLNDDPICLAASQGCSGEEHLRGWCWCCVTA